MNIVLNGEKITVPLCSCGKCLIRRTRDNSKANYGYNQKMSSTYNDYHDEKPMGNSAIYFNRSKRDNFDVSHKEHLPSLLISTMKFDYKPYRVKLDHEKKELVKIKTMPFFGNSTYSSFFPNWNCSQKNEPKSKLPFLKIPFRGNSTYGDNFYKKKPATLNPYSKPFNNLEFKGKIYGYPIEKFDDYDKKAYLIDRANKTQNEKSKIIPADYPKKFDSTYNLEFNEADTECNLAKFLKNSGMKNLEI
jgi:hypothetical protein